MANGDATAEGIARLRVKYAELARKYAELVERFDRRVARDTAVYRLGMYGLNVAGTALAAVEGEEIGLSNAQFTALARTGPWQVQDGRKYPTLRALVVSEARERMRQNGAHTFRIAGSDRTLEARFERSRHDGRPVMLVSCEDVTDESRREAELLRTRTALLQRERLRVLGELAAAVAHDLGNTLRGASFQASTLENESVAPDRRKEAVASVRDRIELASRIVTRLHDFARTGSLNVAAVRLDEILRKAVEIVKFELEGLDPPIRIVLHCDELPPIRGAVGELSYLFVNLLRNAREAMPGGGTISVTARARRGRIVVSVLDEGAGLSPDTQKRLFEPFFTSKGASGTGLGLWLAKGTMERAGGTIAGANRRDRRGAVFMLEFPITRISASPAAAASGARGSPAPRPRRRAPRSGPPTSPAAARGRARRGGG